MPIKYHDDVEQGSDEWRAMRCGLLTASEVKLILTPTLKQANNDKSRSHVWEIAAQRITRYVEPSYVGDNMIRGWEDEIKAATLYEQKYAPVETCGFITNDAFGFTMGYSPDGLVGDDGLIECKSRIQKYQIETIVGMSEAQIPEEFKLQVQAGLIISGRKWCDFLSYSAGLPMVRIRCELDPTYESAILEAAHAFEAQVQDVIDKFRRTMATHSADLHATEREEEGDIV